jgi:hypothetical protein
MRYSFLATIGLTLLFGGPTLATASIIQEAELAADHTNNTIATAESISAGSFTLPVPSTVFNPPGWQTATIEGKGGGNDVDFYAFTTTTSGDALFDVDNAAYPQASRFTDSRLTLFNTEVDPISHLIVHRAIAECLDSSPADSGSASSWDPFLGTISNLSAGTYYIAVSADGNYAKKVTATAVTRYYRPDDQPTARREGGYSVTANLGDDFSGGNTSAGTGLSYTLHISLSAVPEPSTLVLLSIGGAIIAAYACRRRKRA